MKRIVIVTGKPLAGNPRTLKEAEVLCRAGHQVTILGGSFTSQDKEADKKLAAGAPWNYQVAFDLGQKNLSSFLLKLQRRIGQDLWKKFRVESNWQLNYGVGHLSNLASRLNADLTIAHWEPALPTAAKLRKESKRVGIDMEDWFSEDLLPEARRNRPIRLLKKLERDLLCHGAYSSCTSEAMADALVKEYGCRRPVVIRNMFPLKDREGLDGKWKDRPAMVKSMERNDPSAERPKEAPVSIHWFSQTVGPGRGLEELLEAAARIEGEFELHLRGDIGGYGSWLESCTPGGLKNRLHVHQPVSFDQLLSRIAEHDIGYCGEPSEPPNKNLTISNKLFQYLQGGLAVVATATAGQQEAAREAKGAVLLVRPGDVDELRQSIQCLLRDRKKLRTVRTASWEAGGRLCWENEAPKLDRAVEEAWNRMREAFDRRSRD